MDILLLNGSPRPGGNTHILLEAVLSGIREGGGEAELVHLAPLAIAPCAACSVCEQTGRCAIHDAMTGLAERIVKTRHLVIGSPIYFYGLTAQARAFVDRCQVFWARKYLLDQEVGEEGRAGYFVGTAASGGARCFDGARLTLRYAFDALDMTFQDEVVVQGVDAKGAVSEKPETLAAARALGRRIAAAG